MDYNPPGSSVHGILQARTLSLCAVRQVASVMSDSLRPYGRWSTRLLGIPQARTLEWFAMPSSRGSSLPKFQTHVSHVSCIGRQVTTSATWEAHTCHYCTSFWSTLFSFNSDSIPTFSSCSLSIHAELF